MYKSNDKQQFEKNEIVSENEWAFCKKKERNLPESQK